MSDQEAVPNTTDPATLDPVTTGPSGSGPGLAGQPTTESGLTHRQILVVFSGLMLGMLLAALDQTIVATALPTIVGDLHGLNRLSWVVTAYLLTSTASAPLYGKISDLYGRKRVFQGAILIFLTGSVLSGLSQTMNQLVAFRAIQGLGAGGLIVLATTIIGDIVSPRERGRYQGYFGAVFGLASVAGPLLGGFLVEGPGWRWIFYVNLPIGAVALVVTSLVLKDSIRRRAHRIDFGGAGLMVAGVSALLLVTVWAGNRYPWSSPTIIGLVGAGIGLIVAFLVRERHAAEPILPLRLFANRVFSVASAMGFIVGVAMFGAIIFLPVYLQLVNGVSPTVSGLLLIPLVVGLFVASIGSGQIISRVGRYKIFPILGTALMAVGLWLLSHLGVHTSHVMASLYMLVLGVGIGGVMQVLVLATQNAVDYADLGVATSLATFFRSLGGAFGTSIFGAILTSRLTHLLPQLLPPGTPAKSVQVAFTGSPAALARLSPAAHSGAVTAFVRSLHTVFTVGVPFALAAFVLAWLLPEIQLRRAVKTDHQVPAAESVESEGSVPVSESEPAGVAAEPEPAGVVAAAKSDGSVQPVAVAGRPGGLPTG